MYAVMPATVLYHCAALPGGCVGPAVVWELSEPETRNPKPETRNPTTDMVRSFDRRVFGSNLFIEHMSEANLVDLEVNPKP
jgi:hypothetical protein